MNEKFNVREFITFLKEERDAACFIKDWNSVLLPYNDQERDSIFAIIEKLGIEKVPNKLWWKACDKKKVNVKMTYYNIQEFCGFYATDKLAAGVILNLPDEQLIPMVKDEITRICEADGDEVPTFV